MIKIRLFLMCCIITVLSLSGCSWFTDTQESLSTGGVPHSAADPAARWRNLDLKKYPNADTILLNDIEVVEYNSDASYLRKDEYWSLIVTEAGRRESRTMDLPYNEFYNTLPTVEIELIKPDGRVVKPKLQTRVTTEAGQMNSNIYDPANKVLSVGIPDLEIGDIVHCKWSRRTVRARMQNIWCDIAVLQGRQPILNYSYTISAPENAPLKKLLVKDEVPGTLKKSEKRANGRIFHTFEAANVPQVIPEPDMPPYYLHSMRVLASTAENWQEISRWYYNLCEPRLQAGSPELTAFAQKLAAGKTPRQVVRALFDYVSKEIRYTGVTNENTAPGYEPHDVRETFAQKHGVCRDKAALLAAMLRAAGMDGFMVLFMAGDPKDPEVPNNYFNHAITGVKLADGELLLMDPTDENSSDLLPAYGMDKSYLCATQNGDTLRRSPVIPAAENELEVVTQGALTKDFKLNLTSTLTFKGFNDNIYRGAFARWPQDYRQQFAASALKRVLPGAVLKNVTVLPQDLRDLSKAFQLVLEYEVADYVNIKWAAGEMRMPFIGGGFGALNFMLSADLLKERRYPMHFESTAAVREECHITLPENLQAVALPVYKKIDNEALEMSAQVKLQGKKLSGTRYIALNKLEVPQKAYSGFRKAIQDIASAGKRRIIVNRSWSQKNVAEAANAPAMVQKNLVKTVFSDVNNCVIELSGTIKVLNYSGIKEYSELSNTFVPGFSKAEFVSGSVTAPDGKVLKVDPASIKVMDAGDGNAAPRYPVVRKVVVPLPGVAVGSRIDYCWRITLNDAQNAAQMWELPANLPQRVKKVVIVYPQRLERKLNITLPESGFEIKKYYEKRNVVISVEGKNIPMLANEPATPPKWLFAPAVGISSMSESYWSNGMKAFRKAADKADKAMELARQLTINEPDMRRKIVIIRNYVAKNIRAAGPEIDTLGWRFITPADTTLADGYGNSIDRAVLLYAMLKAAGVSNLGVIAASGFPGTPEFTARYNCRDVLPIDFAEVLVLAKVNEEDFYLNDTGEYAQPGSTNSENALAVNLETGEYCTVVPAAECRSSIEQNWRIKCLPGNGAEITRITSFYGSEYEKMNRFFAEITPENEQQYKDRLAATIAPDAELVRFSRDFKAYPGRVEVTLKVPEFWQKSGRFVYLTLPSTPAESYIRTAGTRTLPYWYNGSVDFRAHFSVLLLPEWRECELAPAGYMRSIPGCSSTISLRSSLGENTLELENIVRWEPFFLNAGAYSLLEDLQKQLSNPANRTFLFKTTGK